VGRSATSKYYKKNPEARAKRLAYQKEYNKRESEIAKRVYLNKLNRQSGDYGNGDNMDKSEYKDGTVKNEPAPQNRADKGLTKRQFRGSNRNTRKEARRAKRTAKKK
jgi:hypothetical protein